MLKQIKFGILVFAAIAFFAACKNDASRDQAVQAAAGTDPAAVTTPAVTQPVTPTPNEAQPAAPVGPTTAIQFNETEFNFGKVKAGEKVQHEYVFKNTGKEPLIISDAKGSCGCTVPEWPKEPIPVGGSGKLKVEFDSKGKNGPQTKQVTVTANTNPPQTIIYIKGDVMGEAPAANPNIQVNQ